MRERTGGRRIFIACRNPYMQRYGLWSFDVRWGEEEGHRNIVPDILLQRCYRTCLETAASLLVPDLAWTNLLFWARGGTRTGILPGVKLSWF